MAEPAKNPEVMGALIKGVIIEVVLVAIGVAVYFGTGSVIGIFIAVALSAPVMVLLLAQAGALKRNERR